MHIYEEIDNLHIITFTVKYFYPLLRTHKDDRINPNRNPIEIDEKMRCYET